MVTDRQPNHRELTAIARFLILRHLEIERGLRPPSQLVPYLTPTLYRLINRPDARRYPHGGPVCNRDVGAIRLERLGDDHAIASATTRLYGDRWGAIIVQLRRNPAGQWRAHELRRLDTRTIPNRASAPREPVSLNELTQLIRHAEDEWSLAARALRAERTRLTDPKADLDHRARQQAHQLAGVWQDRLLELNDELHGLRARYLTIAAIHAGRSLGTRQVPGYILRLLGPQPDEPSRRELWQTACTEIERYRARWHIDDHHSALGTVPTDPAQQAHRAELVEALRVATSAPVLVEAEPIDQTQRRQRSVDLAW